MKLDLKPTGKIVHNFASCLWITCGQLGIWQIGGWQIGEEREADGALLGYFVIGLALRLHCH